MREFVEKIKEVDVKSLEFHLSRGDFERWVVEVLEDKLADAIRSVGNFQPVGQVLRDQLWLVVWKRYRTLRRRSRR